MAAYLIADVDVHDHAAYEEYRQHVPATIARYGGRYVARAAGMEVLEGDWAPARLVILEFPDMARLQAWYDSPEYRPLRDIRHRAARSRLVVVEGI